MRVSIFSYLYTTYIMLFYYQTNYRAGPAG